MKLATLRTQSRDGQLLVVSRDLTRAVPATEIAHTLQAALDDWPRVAPALQALSDRLNVPPGAPQVTRRFTMRPELPGVMPFRPELVAAPLPRAYHWVDGSAYVNHV